ncbi:MAG: DUF2911 domain-containing protein [Gloeobacteraceae cyanobacterium ES-bin-316]|nr:DUF2911 domain-containing protein [Ferruginibacter sp.]
MRLFSSVVVILILSSCLEKNKDKTPVTTADTLKLPPANQYSGTDQSPMDISYYPPDFPQNKMSAGVQRERPVARVIYSRPHKKGRIIFSNEETSLCPYDKPWRLGANEATEIEFFEPVIIDGKNVSAGRYTMYCIPSADKWIIAINTNIDTWGLLINPAKDILRTEVPVQLQEQSLEDFTMFFVSSNYGADLVMAWDKVKTVLPISFSQ